LYFVLDLAPNGELYQVIRRETKLSVDCARFVAAELISILEYMHGLGVAHRDLKPANLLLDENYHLKLVDFGTAKILDLKELNRRSTARESICIDIE
jgi:3-phosphoinositide dependent protein kinase-1